jgi:hypothetical protein
MRHLEILLGDFVALEDAKRAVAERHYGPGADFNNSRKFPLLTATESGTESGVPLSLPVRQFRLTRHP